MHMWKDSREHGKVFIVIFNYNFFFANVPLGALYMGSWQIKIGLWHSKNVEEKA